MVFRVVDFVSLILEVELFLFYANEAKCIRNVFVIL